MNSSSKSLSEVLPSSIFLFKYTNSIDENVYRTGKRTSELECLPQVTHVRCGLVRAKTPIGNKKR